MRIIYPNLIRAMRDKRITRARLAAELGMSKEALSRRLRGITDWKLHEVVRICEILETVNVAHLFLQLNITRNKS